MFTCSNGHEVEIGTGVRGCAGCKKCYMAEYRRLNKERLGKKNLEWFEKNREETLRKKRDKRTKEDSAKWYQNRLEKRPLDNIWRDMIARCTNPNHHKFSSYGGRGIVVHKAWLGDDGYTSFAAYMGERPSEKHSVDRILTDGNYEPGNVKWSTPKEQQRNRRINVNITINGRTQCISAWAEESGINITTLAGRWKSGWSPEEMLNKPDRSKRTYYRGKR